MQKVLSLLTLLSIAALPLTEAQAPTPRGSPTASATPKKQTEKAPRPTPAPVTIGSPPPLPPPKFPGSNTATVPAPTTQKGDKQVWVNTVTHLYYKEGSKWYGKTKHGKHMTEQDAIEEGDRPAKNDQQ
jgi:hypothetical protein